MKKLSLVLGLVLVLGVSNFAIAQEDGKTVKHEVKVEIPQYALVGLSSTEAITLYPEAPKKAGEGLKFTGDHITDNSKWLNYSYLASSKGKASVISVKLEESNLPEGIVIGLKVGNDQNKGKGQAGKPSNGENNEIDITSGANDVVGDIKSCYTGVGVEAGHQLTYHLKMGDLNKYSELASGNYSTKVVYTITEK